MSRKVKGLKVESGEYCVVLRIWYTLSMKKVTNKKMTIDDLAVMVAKGFDGVHNELGEFKKEVDIRFNEVKKDIAEVKENLASTRRDVLSMGDKFTMKLASRT